METSLTGGEFLIRRYDGSDLDAVITVFQRAIRQTACRDYAPDQVAAWSTVDRAAWARARASRPTWLAVAGTTVAGFSDLELDGHLDMMFVNPDFAGQGVASLLLATVETAARHQGLPRLFTEASITARPFFARRGFVVDAAQVVEKRGVRLANYRMHKVLAPDLGG
jgi:putative acetyltransferase